MTKASALYNFFSSFGLPAYEENSIYDSKMVLSFPYLTYEVKTDSFGNNDTSISFSLWYRSSSWVQANAKSAEISAGIGRVGKLLECDEGKILIRRSQPFAQNMGDDSDNLIKRIVHNVSIRFYTNN